MKDTVSAHVSQGNLSEEQQGALKKLAESRTFASAPRLRKVLEFLVEHLENGTTDEVNEQSIGQEVFGRPAGYNASEDNIVRVTVRHLRARLEEYYRQEGHSDVWILTIPKGKYVPLLLQPGATGEAEVFHHHQPESAAPREVPDQQPVRVSPQAASTSTAEPRHASSLRIAGFAWTLLALIVGATAGYLLRSPGPLATASSKGLLTQLCPPGNKLSVVVVDSNLQAFRQIFHQQVTLDDYIRRSYGTEMPAAADPRVADAHRFAMDANETNVSSAIVAAAFGEAVGGHRINIKHPHDVSIRDFQEQEDIVLLGGPNINPWGQLFESRLNFRISIPPAAPAASYIHNQAPAAGEPQDYFGHRDSNFQINYARIAILPNFENSARVILIGATSGEALEGAGTFLLSPQCVTELLNRFHVRTVASLPPLEFVLEVRGINSVPDGQHIVAVRALSANSSTT